MKIKLPDNVRFIINELERQGYEAYAVGGCVRDTLLGREPGDWDITTSAKPEEVKTVFKKTVDTGIEHGTVTVIMDGTGYEVTTYRIDGKYSDGRHPDKVEFTPSLTEDLKRRDFTINAMAYNESTGMVDLFGGLEDLEKGIIRCVGNPKERFNEDALRIFRAVRFSAQLGFDIEEGTKQAIKELAESLTIISAERIQTELVKLLMSDHPEKIRDCYELSITTAILPEFDLMMATSQNTIHHRYTVGEHTIKVLENVPAERIVRITALLHDVAKPETKKVTEDGQEHFPDHQPIGADKAAGILRRLKFDNDTINKVKTLIRWHDARPETLAGLRRLLNNVGEELFPTLISFKYGDIMGQSEYKREEKLAVVDGYKASFEQIISERQCFSLKQLAVTGNDLIAEGIPAGAEIGRCLKNLLDLVTEDQSLNDKETLLSMVRDGKL